MCIQIKFSTKHQIKHIEICFKYICYCLKGTPRKFKIKSISLSRTSYQYLGKVQDDQKSHFLVMYHRPVFSKLHSVTHSLSRNQFCKTRICMCAHVQAHTCICAHT